MIGGIMERQDIRMISVNLKYHTAMAYELIFLRVIRYYFAYFGFCAITSAIWQWAEKTPWCTALKGDRSAGWLNQSGSEVIDRNGMATVLCSI